MRLPRLSCEVEADGIAHVFPSFGVGERCACARTVVALSDDERELVVRRSFGAARYRPAASPAGRPPQAAPVDEREGLLHGGNVTIAYARALCARVRVERARLHEGRRRRAAVLAARGAPGWDAP